MPLEYRPHQPSGHGSPDPLTNLARESSQRAATDAEGHGSTLIGEQYAHGSNVIHAAHYLTRRPRVTRQASSTLNNRRPQIHRDAISPRRQCLQIVTTEQPAEAAVSATGRNSVPIIAALSGIAPLR